MAGIKVGTRGGANLPPENRKTPLSKKCQTNIERTRKVVKKLVFSPSKKIKPKITSDAPGSKKVSRMLFKKQTKPGR